MASHVWNKAIVPAMTFMYNEILSVLVKKIARCISYIIIDVAIKKIIRPLFRYTIRVISGFYNNIVVPLCKRIGQIAEAIFITFPKWCYHNIIKPSVNLV